MMRRISAIQLPAVILLFCAIAPGLVAQTQTVQPEKTGPTQRQRQGFLDYALGKINPSNTDYGTAMANGRSDLVGHTIDDLYFWSNAVTLGLLVCSAGILYFEWRFGKEGDRRRYHHRGTLERPRQRQNRNPASHGAVQPTGRTP
jgi:hypothetical protein